MAMLRARRPAPGAHAARAVAALLLLGLFALPLLSGMAYGLADAVDAEAWHELLKEPALPRALAINVTSAIMATGLTLAIVLACVPRLYGTAAWAWLLRALGPMLAMPHAAFAIGLALWLMPSGLPARLLALPMGWTSPPDVASLHDPWGLGLVLGLAAKESPFLLWCTAAQLARGDVGRQLRQQMAAGRSLGYGAGTLWWRVLWPQFLPRLGWPLAAVWAYALTALDMALVLGPAQPPTLAMLGWVWLQEPDPARQRLGAAAALLLAGVLLVGVLVALVAWRAMAAWITGLAVRGDRATSVLFSRSGQIAVSVLGLGYAMVLLLLALASVAPAWPFPALWPPALGGQAWELALGSSSALGNTVSLGLASAASGLLLALVWLETTPVHWDSRAAALLFLPLWWPGILLAAGLYRGLLPLGLDGTWAGVWLAHGLTTAPYAWMALAPSHRGYDPRYRQVALAAGCSRMAFLWRVKWPMLGPALAAAFAVAFAVSVAQYPSTQLVGSGRWPTLATEALTLAAGGQRDRVAAFALLQAVVPAMVFLAVSAASLRLSRNMGGAGAVSVSSRRLP